MVNRAVFLDRDGVLNRAVVIDGRPHPPASLDELVIEEGTAPALQELRGAGFLLIGVTNQPDVARGTQRRETVEAINGTIVAALPLQDILTCYHDGDGCGCRKPQPGLLLQAAEKYSIDLPASFMVGDRWKDTEAGYRAGCRTVFIDYRYSESEIGHPPDYRAHSLSEAASWILNCPRGETQ